MTEHPNAQKIVCQLNGRALALIDNTDLYLYCKDNRCKKFHKYPVREIVSMYIAQGGDHAILLEMLKEKEVTVS